MYTGKPNTITFHPAIENTGLAFVVNNQRVPATIENAKHCKRAIAVTANGVTAYLVEHVASAAYGIAIDNLIMELSDGVVPTMRTCAKEYTEELLKRRKPQDAPAKLWQYGRQEPWQMTWRVPGTRIRVEPHDTFTIDDTVDYPHKAVRIQQYAIDITEENYQAQIMTARSPAILPIPYEWAMDLFLWLGKRGWHGVTDENYLLISSKAAKTYRNPDNSSNPKLEFVRHKVLDVLGTLALTGKRFVNTKFSFYCSGHAYDIPAVQTMLKKELFVEAISPQQQTPHPSPAQGGVADTSRSVPQTIAPTRHPDESSALS